MTLSRTAAALGLLVLLSQSTITAQNLTNEDLWAAADNELVVALRRGDKDFDKKYLTQLTAFPVYANWDAATTRYKLYMIANQIPKWGPTWAWNSGRRLDDAFGLFVDAIDIGTATNPKKDAEIKKLGLAWANARELANAERDRLTALWEKALAKNPKTNKQLWWTQRSAKLSTLLTASKNDFLRYNKALDPNARTMANLIQRYDLALANQIQVRLPSSAADATSDTADPSNFPVVSMLPFVADDSDLALLKSDGEKQLATGKPAVEWAITSESKTRFEERKAFGGSFGFGGFVRIISISGNYSDHHIKNSDKSFRLSFKAWSMQLVQIGPSPDWYAPLLTELFACGPFKKNKTFKANDLWKEGGMLSLVPSAALVAYKPTVEVTFSKEDYEEIQKALAGSAGLSIGPFSFGGGGSGIQKEIKHDQVNRRVSIAITSDTPMVLAVLSTRLNPGKTCETN